MTKNNKTFNVCYLREYMDPEHQGEYFYAYETVYRNVPVKYKSKFNDKTKLKIVKFLDWNYKETAANYVNVSRVELIDQKQYYQSYKDVFGDVDEADEDYIPLVQDNSKPQITTAGEESDQEVKVVEERMSEEDLLKAMQDNMVDKKNNRRSF